ncbi:hypothetical protein GBF38_000071 [Nibea albiflora]|nr:hypothetical protein GBF38_000071 [Nibea albiflora]
MEDLHMNNTSQNYSFNYSNNTYDENSVFVVRVVTYIIIGVGLPLTLVGIYALYCQVRNGQVAPIYVINLLITDIIQLCCLIVGVKVPVDWNIEIQFIIYTYSLLTSVGFMVCVALERRSYGGLHWTKDDIVNVLLSVCRDKNRMDKTVM